MGIGRSAQLPGLATRIAFAVLAGTTSVVLSRAIGEELSDLRLSLLAVIAASWYAGIGAGLTGGLVGAGLTLVVSPHPLSPIDVAAFTIESTLAAILVGSLRGERAHRATVERGAAAIRRGLIVVIDRLPEAILLFDRSGRVTLASRAAIDLFEGSVPTDTAALGGRLERPEGGGAAGLVAELLSGNEAASRQALLRGREKRALLCTAARLPVAGADDPVALLVLFDIDELKQQERERIEPFALLGHELKTPLTTLNLRLNALERAAGQGDVGESARLAGAMRQGLARIERVLDEMMTLSGVQTGRLRVAVGPVDLERSTHEAVMRTAVPDGRRIDLRIDNAISVLADEDRLAGVLDHLIGNALQYGAEGPVTLEASAEDVFGRLRVRSCGPLIEEDDRRRLFTPFFRGRHAAGRPGSGIGLYLSRQIAQRLGGDLVLESSTEEGTVFRLDLPLARAEGASP